MEISQLINIGVRNTYSMAAIENQGCVSDSLMNEYVPFFSAFHADFKRVGGVRYSIYQTPPSHVGYGTTNKIANFKRALEGYAGPLTYLKGEHRYEVIKNCIFTREGGQRDKMLYCLAIKTDYLLGTPGSDARPDFNNLDYTKLIILLDRNFTEAPDRRLMYNFLKREVIQPLLDLGIDMVITNSVNRWCFKDSASPVNFNTMSEMREFLNNLSNNIIDGITGRERPAEIAQPVSEPETTEADALRIFDELLRGGDEGDDTRGEAVLGELEDGAIEDEEREDWGTDEDPFEANRELILGREDLATERGREIHEVVEGRTEQPTTPTPGIGGEAFTIPFRAEDFTNFNILQQPPTSPTGGGYAIGFDPYQQDTAEGVEPHHTVYIRERTGTVDEDGRPQERYRAVEPNLTGGIDISYGARRREDIGGFTTDPASTQRDPIIQYQPQFPQETRQELSREDLWSIPRREAQSSEESQEGNESTDPIEDDGLPY